VHPSFLSSHVAQHSLYKGRAINARDVRKELALLYLLEGSVQKAATTSALSFSNRDRGGHTFWSSRFDGGNPTISLISKTE